MGCLSRQERTVTGVTPIIAAILELATPSAAINNTLARFTSRCAAVEDRDSMANASRCPADMTNGAAALFMRTAYQTAAIYFGDIPLVLDPGGDPGGVPQQTLRSISVAVPSGAKVQNHSVGPPIWDSCDGRPDTQGWSYVINAYQFTSAHSAATVVAGGCHQLITPAPRFNRLLAPCPRHALTAGDSRPIAGSSGWPRPAQSSGPPRWIARIKLVPKLTVRVRFPSPAPCSNTVAAQANPTVSLKQVNAHSRPKTALVQLRVPLAILASAPGDCQFLS